MSTDATAAKNQNGVDAPEAAPAAPATAAAAVDKGKGKSTAPAPEADEPMDEDEEDDEEDEDDDDDEEEDEDDDDAEEIDPSAIRPRRTRGVKVDYTSPEALAKAGLTKEELERDEE